MFNHKSGRSQKKSVNSFNMHQTYVSKILKKYSNIRAYKNYKKTTNDSAPEITTTT
jgi:hypothetical protein